MFWFLGVDDLGKGQVENLPALIPKELVPNFKLETSKVLSYSSNVQRRQVMRIGNKTSSAHQRQWRLPEGSTH
jgi:hypothetical protein